jgi:glycosyltransferase involved in cell wall biosynthesis
VNRTVAVVTNIPRPYRRALFNIVQQQLAAQDLGLRLLYTSNPAKHVRRGSPSGTVVDPAMESYVTGLSFQIRYERVFVVPTRLRPALAHVEPDCVVSGGFGAATVMAARWCHRARAPLVLWSGAWPGQEGDLGLLHRTVRRRLVDGADAFVAYGTAAAEYLTTLGAPPERVFCAWNTVDLEGISAAARAAAARRTELAPKFALAARNLLFVGSLVERKGLRELILAALAVEAPSTDWALHLAGGGPLKEELEATVAAAGKRANFRFHGLLSEGDVAELLGLVDGFLLPTKREAWGLVLNEAMACGVPVVSSPWAGATRDLIEDGVTGYVVEPTDIPALAAIISRLLSDDPGCREVGRAGAKAVREKASLDRAAEGFVAAINCAMEKSRNG